MMMMMMMMGSSSFYFWFPFLVVATKHQGNKKFSPILLLLLFLDLNLNQFCNSLPSTAPSSPFSVTSNSSGINLAFNATFPSGIIMKQAVQVHPSSDSYDDDRWFKGIAGRYELGHILTKEDQELEIVSFHKQISNGNNSGAENDKDSKTKPKWCFFCTIFPKLRLPKWATDPLYSRASQRVPFPIHLYVPSNASAPHESWVVESHDQGVNQVFYFPSKSGSTGMKENPLFIYFPGNGDVHWSFSIVTEIHSRYGYDVALVDYRGHNSKLPRSEINEEGLTLDAVNSVRSLVIRGKITRHRPVFLMGLSLGTGVLLSLVRRLTHLSEVNGAIKLLCSENIKGIILDAPFVRIGRAASDLAKSHVPSLFYVPKPILGPIIDFALYSTGHYFNSEKKLKEILQKYEGPIWNGRLPLLILGNEKDTITTVDQAQRLYQIAVGVAGTDKTVKIYRSFDVPHGGSMDCGDDFYNQLGSFFKIAREREINL